MRKPVFILCTIALYLCSCTPPTEKEATVLVTQEIAEVVSEDELAINEVVKKAYAIISFEEGASPNYDGFGEIFTPDAILHNFRSGTLETLSISDLIEGLKAGIEAGELVSFDEIELGGETEYFGKVGHRISSYATHLDQDGVPDERGVNSFQLLNLDGTWKVSSIIWDIEKEGQAIPDKYIDDNK